MPESSSRNFARRERVDRRAPPRRVLAHVVRLVGDQQRRPLRAAPPVHLRPRRDGRVRDRDAVPVARLRPGAVGPVGLEMDAVARGVQRPLAADVRRRRDHGHARHAPLGQHPVGHVQAERGLAGRGRRGRQEGVAGVIEDLGRRGLLPRAQRTGGGPGRQGAARRGAGRSVDLVRHGTGQIRASPDASTDSLERERHAKAATPRSCGSSRGERDARVAEWGRPTVRSPFACATYARSWRRRWGNGVPMGERGPRRTYRPDMTPPTVYGAHQPGIVTPQLAYALLTVYDTEDPGPLLREWTAAAERLMRATNATGDHRPAGQAAPAVRRRRARPTTVRWRPRVLISGRRAAAAPRSASNPRWERRGTHPRAARSASARARSTCAGRSTSTATCGSAQRPDRDDRRHLPRRARHPRQRHLARPHATEQERDHRPRASAPAPRSPAAACSRSPSSTTLAPDAHIRVATPRTAGVALLRRGYDTDEGLLFLAFMPDPRRQFVPLQQRLAQHDALHPHTRTVGSAVFAIPPGATPESLYAQPLL